MASWTLKNRQKLSSNSHVYCVTTCMIDNWGGAPLLSVEWWIFHIYIYIYMCDTTFRKLPK